MLETITVITLTLLLMSILRPGKTPPLDNPLVIERPGQYHMTLAPQLNLAQPFIEAIAAQLGAAKEEMQDGVTQYFEVCDKQVTAHGHDCYLLTITLRDGMLYFQASNPQSVEQAITHHDDRRILAAVQEAATIRSISIKQL